MLVLAAHSHLLGLVAEDEEDAMAHEDTMSIAELEPQTLTGHLAQLSAKLNNTRRQPSITGARCCLQDTLLLPGCKAGMWQHGKDFVPLLTDSTMLNGLLCKSAVGMLGCFLKLMESATMQLLNQRLLC